MPISLNEAYQRIAGFDLHERRPNPMQETIFQRVMSGDCAALLKAPTGSGKTEAVLVPALTGLLDGEHPRRLFLILPTRSLVDDQVQRIEKVFSELSRYTQRRLALVVDTGGQSYRKLWQNGTVKTQRRHLYDGDVILTTLDKFVYRFFSFGEPFKNYIFPLRIHYGAKKPLFCFDEAHTYEDVAFTNFVNLVHTLAIEKGHDVVVMTATMPKEYARHLEFLDLVDFINGEDGEKLKRFYQRPHEVKILEYVFSDENELVSKLAMQAMKHYQKGRRVIVTTELVKDAVDVFEQLRERYGNDVLLYHGRIPDIVETYPDKGRIKIYKELKQRDEKDGGYLLVTTSAIEVGCDLNAHTLITEICNPDQLLQRAGRCNRKGQTADARVIVVGNKIKDFLSDLDENEQTEYIETLKALHCKPLEASAILAHLHVKPQMDYRVQKMFEMLYEYVYEADQVYKGLHEKGMVITRSWEPSLTVCTGFDENDHPLNPVSVNFRSLTIWKKDDERITPNCTLYRRCYDGDENHRYKFEEVKYGGCAYLIDLYLEVPPEYFDPDTGYKKLPIVFSAWKDRTNAYRELARFVHKSSVPAGEVTKGKRKQSKRKEKEKEKETENRSSVFWYLTKLELSQDTEHGADASDEPSEDE